MRQDVRRIGLEEADGERDILRIEPRAIVEPDEVLALRRLPAEQAGLDDADRLALAHRPDAGIGLREPRREGNRVLGRQPVAYQDLEIAERLRHGGAGGALHPVERARDHNRDRHPRLGHDHTQPVDCNTPRQDRSK